MYNYYSYSNSIHVWLQEASTNESTYAETGANFYEDVETGMGFTNYSYKMASFLSTACPVTIIHVHIIRIQIACLCQL